jgi:BMFP domain-containing protein YqiC
MQTNAPFFTDVSKLMTGAMGLAQAASEEARSAFRAQGDRLVAELDLVRRDEMDAALDVLRAEITALRAEVAALRGTPPQG